MPSEQAINQFVGQPINNLLVFLAIVAVLGFIGLGYFGFRFFKYITNPESPLVRVIREVRDAFKGLKESQATKIDELIKATTDQTIYVKDLSNFQKVNNETVANLADAHDTLTNLVNAGAESNADNHVEVMELMTIIDGKLDVLLKNGTNCADLKADFDALRVEINAKMQPLVNAISIQATLPPANVHADTPPAGAQEAA